MTTRATRLVIATAGIFGVAGAYAVGRLHGAPAGADIAAKLAHQEEQLERLGRELQAVRASGASPVRLSASPLADAQLATLKDEIVKELQREPEEAPEPPPAPTPANLAAFTRARSIVDGALATKVWRDAEAEELKEVRRGLTASQGQEVLRELIVAMNSGNIAVRTTGPAF